MTPKILLIDDDSDDRDFFCEALESLALPCIFNAMPGALQAFYRMDNKEIEKPDIIFLDINMPVIDGWECLKKLKEREEYKSIPVIMYSTSSYLKDINKAARLHAFCFFSKPSSFKELKSSLEIVIKHLMNNTLPLLVLNSSLFVKI